MRIVELLATDVNALVVPLLLALHQIVVQNVQLIRIAPLILPVFVRNVKILVLEAVEQMLCVQWSTTVQFVLVLLAILETLLATVMKNPKDNQNSQEILATQVPAEVMHNVTIETAWALVHVFPNTLEIHTPDVNQNV